jgi:predicted deacetylase
MNWDTWTQVVEILLEFDVKPILSVVPDNQDETLKVYKAKNDFWDEVRTWQSCGWTIGVHGYQHVYETKDAGLSCINRFSEFSGLPHSEQVLKLRSAIEIFRREGVRPDIWVAPGHSFDLVTLEALKEVGIHSISDGFFLHPHRDRSGMIWIPQQLWRFRRMPLGVWTVCHHINHWAAEEVARLRRDVRQFAELLTDCESVIATYRNRRMNPIDSMYARLHRMGVRSRQWWLATGRNP